MRARKIGLALLGLLVLAGALYGVSLYKARQLNKQLDTIKAELAAGYRGTARYKLEQLALAHGDSAEIQYLIGICDLADGRPNEAEARWLKIRPTDPITFGLAALHLAELDRARGRLTQAEERLRTALPTAGEHAHRLRWALVQLLAIEGRLGEAKSEFEAGVAEVPNPVEGLKQLYKLENDPYPSESAAAFLGECGRQTPDDDRVWLGQAYNALQTGRWDDAQALLEKCLARRAEDRAAWEFWLRWALAAGRPDEVARSLRHLPNTPALQAEIPAIRLWLARRLGDRQAERAILESALASQSDASLLESLALLDLAEQKPERAADLRRQRVLAETDRKEYLKALGTPVDIKDAPRLAQLARRAGRGFDARFWEAPGDDLRAKARSVSVATRAEPQATTLAEAFPDLLSGLDALRSDNLSRSTSAQITPRFVDRSTQSGLVFTHDNGSGTGQERRLIPPITMSGGVALLDYDGDGRLDVYAVQSGPFPPVIDPNADGDRLFHQQPDGSFVDATRKAGLAGRRGYGHGVAVGDINGDGHPDLFVTRWRSYSLYRNRGDGTFEDITTSAGLGGDRDWPTSAAFGDLDNDGDLDLYVTHYLKWDDKDQRPCVDKKDPTIYNCSPRDFEALPDHLFRNDGGRFVDVTKSAGIVDRDGRGLGVVMADLDRDGKIDIYVANDLSANYLWRNQGGLKFEEVALAAGAAANSSGRYQAGMGVACADQDGDGLPDIAVTNFYNESTTLFRNLGKGFFADQSAETGLASASRYLLGFGIAFADFNNDRHLDLVTANGHIHDGRPQFPFEMPLQILIGNGSGRLVDVSRTAGDPFQVARLGRGLATGDVDNDGRTDMVVLSQNSALAYLHNETEPSGRSLTLLLEGRRSNRDAVGAEVTVTAAGKSQTAFRVGGGSYQSASEPRLQIALGSATTADRVEVRWTSGQVDVHRALAPGGYRLIEGDGNPQPLPAWAPTERTNR